MDFTDQQSQAINAEPKANILVSASAGSGKTRVLVERVIRKIKDYTNIDNLLIVTFTKAAAKEMQDRIRVALQKAISETTDLKLQRYLLRQIRKLPVADISTLDSFCQRVVQHYYYVINLDPDFRILTDATEIQLLRDQVWENLREDLYIKDDDNSDHRFINLVNNFADDRSDDNLTDLIYNLYDYANVNRDPEKWLDSLPNHYQIKTTLVDSVLYQKDIKPIIVDRLKQLILKYRSALDYAKQMKVDLSKEIAFFEKAISSVQTILNDLDGKSWDELQQLFSKKPVKNFPRGSGSEHATLKDLNTEANRLWQKQIYERYFQLTEAENVSVIKRSEKIIQTLVSVVKEFGKEYQKLKRQRHGMEFIDIEHAAYDILRNAERSQEVRENLQKQYQEIMVDEYQDNNRLQDAILSQVARKNEQGQTNNLFMVGDVKQSIYRFRLSDPNLFLNRQRQYQKPDDQNLNISLSDNFRSAENIDNFVNLIFKQLMDKEVGKINYLGAAELKFGAKYYPNNLDAKVEMMLYDGNQQSNDDSDSRPVNEQFQVDDDNHGQLELVANKIDQLVKNHAQVFDRDLKKMRDVKYSDIAILSATRNQNLVLADVFNQHNIPITISGGESYFKATEIQIMMALLKIIDNPYQDIPLVAVLRSPIVGLNENQLAYIRINRNTGDYYHAIVYFVQNYDSFSDENGYGEKIYQKISRFLQQLADFRDYAHHHELVDLIWKIYQQTGFLDYVGGMPAGKQRQVNLHALYQRAADYEKTSFKGLFQFVRFIERMQEHNQDLAEPIELTNNNNVQVMTIHGSKGLEFPIVFLIDIQHQFNTRETKRSYVLNDQLGIGIDYFDSQYREKVPTLPKQIVLDQIKSENQAEEMRKLYVALTRAEQQLYLVGIAKGKRGSKSTGQENLLAKWHQAHFSITLILDAALRNNANSDLEWFGLTLDRHPEFQQIFDTSDLLPTLSDNATKFNIQFFNQKDLQKMITHQSSGTNQVVKEWLKQMVNQKVDSAKVVDADDINQVLNFKYSNQVATHTTAYQAVSEIKRLFDDPDASDMGQLTSVNNQLKQSNRYANADFKTPQFLQTVSRPSSAEVGTATHLVLQKIDVSTKPNEKSVEKLIQTLVSQKVLSTQVAKYIDRLAIVDFFNSEVGKLILAHPDQLHREVPFSLIMDARDLFKGFSSNSDEKILIHGIIDGYLTLSDRVILFDYKTDYVSNKNVDGQIKRIVDKYRGQLNLYAVALQNILARPIDHRYLYLLSLNRLVKVTN